MIERLVWKADRADRMNVPEHLWRFPTLAAVQSLAQRFSLAYAPEDQDWERTAADSTRIDDFLAAYVSGELDDDERFVLMELLIASFEHIAADTGAPDPRWPHLLALLDQHVELHAFSLWYWADPDDPMDEDKLWHVTPSLRLLLAKHRRELEAKAARPPHTDTAISH